MISTGTDVKPLEGLIFMRDVKSQPYYEQMVGRGTRTIPRRTCRRLRATRTQDPLRPDRRHRRHGDREGHGRTAAGAQADRRLDDILSMVAFGSRDPTRSPRSPRGSRDSTGRSRRGTDGRSATPRRQGTLRARQRPARRRGPGQARRQHAAEANGTDSPTEDQVQEAASELAERAWNLDGAGAEEHLTGSSGEASR